MWKVFGEKWITHLIYLFSQMMWILIMDNDPSLPGELKMLRKQEWEQEREKEQESEGGLRRG